jgi:hypothetical protein
VAAPSPLQWSVLRRPERERDRREAIVGVIAFAEKRSSGRRRRDDCCWGDCRSASVFARPSISSKHGKSCVGMEGDPRLTWRPRSRLSLPLGTLSHKSGAPDSVCGRRTVVPLAATANPSRRHSRGAQSGSHEVDCDGRLNVLFDRHNAVCLCDSLPGRSGCLPPTTSPTIACRPHQE